MRVAEDQTIGDDVAVILYKGVSANKQFTPRCSEYQKSPVLSEQINQTYERFWASF